MPQPLQARLPSSAPASRRALALFGGVFGALLLLLPLAGSSASRLVSQPAPDFALRSFDGQNVRLSEHLGEVVLINFWATWCGPCRQEMPLLDEIYARYRRAGLVLFSVNIDEEQDAAVEMAQTLKVSYPVLFDARKDVSRAYDVGTMPLTVLIDREGVVRYVSEGYKPGYEQRYTDRLRELLNE
jgi:thiol-disulfide isomerase/thioredoxin